MSGTIGTNRGALLLTCGERCSAVSEVACPVALFLDRCAPSGNVTAAVSFIEDNLVTTDKEMGMRIVNEPRSGKIQY